MSGAQDFNAKVIQEFRDNDGKVGGPFEDMTLLVLHTRGARSNRERVNPVATTEFQGDQIIVASNGGSPIHPGWFYNLKANPEVEVEFGSEKFGAIAVISQEPERSELFAAIVERYPDLVDVQRSIDRELPVIRLKRQS